MTQVEYLVYKHTAPNGKSYIGQTFNYQRRCQEHQKQNRCVAFSRAINKYGWNNFKHEILKDGLTLEEANFWEDFYIKKIDTIKPNGYNIRTGGNNSRLHESSKKKIGDANRGRIHSPEVRKKFASFTGKKHSEEHKQYMKDKLKGRKYSSETINKMRQSQMQKMKNPEYKEKCSKGFFKRGHIKTDAHRAAISKAATERWQKFRENKNV